MFHFGTVLKQNVTPIKLQGTEAMSDTDLNSTTNCTLNFKAVLGVLHRKNTNITLKNYSPVYLCYPDQHLWLGTCWQEQPARLRPKER